MLNIIVIVSSVTLNASAQIFLKMGMGTVVFPAQWTVSTTFKLALWAALNPYIIGGLACYAFSVLIWMYVLAHTEVSYAYPFLSIGFALVTVLGWIIFNDSLSVQRVSGIALICLGVVLVSRT